MIGFDFRPFMLGRPFAVATMGGLLLRRLGQSDFERVLKFRSDTVSAVNDPDVLRLMPDENMYVAESLESKNLAVGLFSAEKLVAYNSLFWPTTDDDLRDLNIYEYARHRALPNEIAFAGGLMIGSEFRGAGLQKLLIEVRILTTRHVGRTHHFSTVSFVNYFSWRNILQMGARVVDIFEFEDPRHGHTNRMLTHHSPNPKPLAGDEVWTDPRDIESQRLLLGRGMVGTRFGDAGGRPQIAYQSEVG